MKWNKRPYQIECKKAIKTAYDKGINKQLIVQATGTGKRMGALDLMNNFNRSLFIAHREELIMQPFNDIDKYWPFEVGIIKGPRFEIDKKIVVASVQTLCNRLDKINPETFDYIAVDECHHYASETFLKTVRHFRPKLLTGWTATPKRLDGLNLSNIFEELVFEYGIEKGIQENFLAPIEAYQIKTPTDISSVGKKAGDFKIKELSEAVDSLQRNALIVQKYQQYTPERQGIAFCVDVEHAYNLRDAFRRTGISCETIVSDESRCPNRSELVKAFKNGEVTIITNVTILCLDLKTEILTKRGWLKWNEMNYNDLVANYNLDGSIFFQKPYEIIKRKLYDFEKMVVLKSKQSNIRVTNTHRMIYRSNNKCNWKKTSSEELINKKWEYPSCGNANPIKFILKNDNKLKSNLKRRISANAYVLRKDHNYSFDDSIIEAKKRIELKLNLRYKNPNELTLSECSLIGFWLGDGSINRLIRQGVEYTLCQSKVYPNIINYIDNLLLKCNIDNIKRDKGNYYVWSIPRGTGFGKQKKNGIFHLEPYLNKNGVEYFWGLNKNQMNALIEGLWYADGRHGKANLIPQTKIIGSTFYDLISLLQAILVCRGYKANISKTNQSSRSDKYKELYILTIENRKTQSVKSRKNEFQMNYDSLNNINEEVWCVKTESKNIITRREGRVCIMGNTEGFDHSDVGVGIMARPTQSETLYKQCIGRVTRLKSDAFKQKFGTDKGIILDFVDNTSKHALVNAWELEKDMPIENRLFVPQAHKEKLIEEREKRIRKIQVQIGKDKKINLLRLPEVVVWQSEKMLEMATEAQLKWIRDLGVWEEGIEYTKAMASELISAQPAKEWQVRWLAERQYDVSGTVTNGQYQKVKWQLEQRDKYKMTI
jgi:superfamily II DNA or RNA helicase